MTMTSSGAEAAPSAAGETGRMGRDRSFERAVRFAGELVRIPSLPGEEEAVALRIVDEMRALGFDEARIDRAGNVVGRIAGAGGAPAVMLSSHMDVVDVGDPAAWEHAPYGGVVADGYLHGRGSMDVKGPLAIQLHAAARFVDARPAGDLLMICSVYEEKGGWGMMHHLETLGTLPGAVILSEATGCDLCTGHRGHAELAVEIHGLACHASDPGRGRNPNRVLPHVLLALQEISEAQPCDPVLGRATLTPTVIESWPKSGNVVPDRIRITLDMRVLPGWEEGRAVEEIRARLAERVPAMEGVRVEVLPGLVTHRAWTGWEDEHSNFTPGFLVADDHPVVAAAARAVGEATGRAPRIRQWKFGTDGGHACGTHGIPTLGFAPGIEALAHTSRERLELASARVAFDAYPALIHAVQAALAPAGASAAAGTAPGIDLSSPPFTLGPRGGPVEAGAAGRAVRPGSA
jgi:succinyl-diaminopimelate desuccinylase